MSFLTRIGFVETEEQERARLAAAPEGSINHALSKLPVTIPGWPMDLIIRLPWAATERAAHNVVVVPIEFHEPVVDPDADPVLPRQRHEGSWTCAVVSSDHPAYPVGGYRLNISAAELARGEQITLAARPARDTEV